MNSIFDYLLELISNGYNITFKLNEHGILTVKHFCKVYNEKLKVYEIERKKLASDRLTEINYNQHSIEKFINRIKENLPQENQN